VKEAPNDADGQVALGIDLLSAGENERAYVHLQRATELLPDSEAAWHYFGNGCLAVQKHEQAVASFQRALAINPFHEHSYRDLARTQLALGLLWPALSTLKHAQRIGFWDLECGFDLANQLYKRGHQAEATELARSLQRRQAAPP
jgi:tetratricopeptide (TPR) repeat protein